MTTRPTRVSYREGQRLRAHDLAAEQDYLVALDRAHNATQHTPGVVAGLELRAGSISPGLAIDEDGRVLVLEESVPLPTHIEFSSLDAWLLACETCVGTRNDRRREFARVVFTPVAIISPAVDPVTPRAGAVYLGRLGDAPPTFTSLPASEARDPAARASMQIGPRGTRDRNAFVVNVKDRTGTLTPRITLDVLGNNRFRGEVTVAPYGDEKIGPSLTIDKWSTVTAASPPALHGCREPEPESLAIDRDLTGLGFEPMTAPPPDPPVPGMYAITAGTPAEPVEQLRFDLGKQVDGDLTTRFSVGGAEVTNGPFRDWLRINGKGDLVLSDDPVPNVIPISLTVSGTIQRGPIKPDLADPNFTGLLKLAWLAGLREAIQANTHISLMIATPPAVAVETEETWSFGVTITNLNTIPIVVESVTAIVTHTASNGSTFVKPITVSVNAQLAPTNPMTVVVADVDGFVNPGTFSVKTQVIGKIGNGAWWNELVIATGIPVLEKPVLDLTGIPADVQPNTPFQQDVRVENAGSTHDLTIASVTIGGFPKPGAPLAHNTDHHFIVNHVGITLPLSVLVVVSYSWDDFPSPRTLSATAVVNVDMNFALNMRSSGSAAGPMQFDVAFDNLTDADFRVRSVTHRVVSDTPQELAKPLTKSFKRTVKAGKRTTIRDLAAPMPPAGKARLEVEIEIEAGGEPHIVRKEFDLP